MQQVCRLPGFDADQPADLMPAHAATPARTGPLQVLAVAALALAALCLPTWAQAPMDIRIALVIGNAAYAGDAALGNPANDAHAMADTLTQLGFSVVELRDGSRAQMTESIAKVGEALKGKQGVGMLYYAGHGLQLEWRNYMVPVDARIAASSDIAAQAVDVGAVIDAFKAAGNRMNILVLDACRDNPFAGTASGKGLAQLDAPPGTFLAFATAPGNVAIDGDAKSANGLYTGFLLQELKKPAARIEDVFKRVRLSVRKQSRGRQIPWESTSLEDDFVFNTGVKIAPRPEVADRERAFAQQKADWDRIKDSQQVDDLYAFLQKYPSGLISDLAQNRLNQLQQATIVAQRDQTGVSSSTQTNVLRDGDRYEFVMKDGLTGLVTRRGLAVSKQIGPDLFESVGAGAPPTITNQAGYVRKDSSGTYDPPWSVVPGGTLAVGNKSSARSIRTNPDGSQEWVDIDSRIIARERITTALGTLDTYRIEVEFSGQAGWHYRLTFWYEPEWGYAALMRREGRTSSGAPDIRIREVTARKRRG